MNDRILIELRSSLLDRMKFESIRDDIWKRSSALNTWGTNAIEGSTITWEDAKKILFDKKSVKDKPIRDVMETIQHERTFRGLLTRMGSPITLVTVLELHEDIFKGILEDAGMWRNINVRIHGANFTPPRMEKVIEMMEYLIEEYNKKRIEGGDPFELGAWFHHNFEVIHPFSDGNGRVGRLLLNLHFLAHNWPPVHILPGDRDLYLNSLNSATDGDNEPLIQFLMMKMSSSLLDLLDQVGTGEDELVDLKKGTDHTGSNEKYLGLLCRRGELPAILRKHKWYTSYRAMDLYRKYEGRSRT